LSRYVLNIACLQIVPIFRRFVGLVQLLKSGDIDRLYSKIGHLYDDDVHIDDFDDDELEYLYSSNESSYEELPINTQNVTSVANNANTMATKMENAPKQMETAIKITDMPILPDQYPIISSPSRP